MQSTSKITLGRIMSPDIAIRWIIGEDRHEPMRRIGYDLLDMSIAFADLLFPNAKKIITSALILGNNRVEEIASRHSARFYKVSDFQESIPLRLQNRELRHPFYKYMPFRLHPYLNEIVIENDVILWSIPPAIPSWMYSGGMLGLGTDRASNYPEFHNRMGVYTIRVKDEHPNLWLNTGLIGFGPGMKNMILSLEALDQVSEFDDEMGWFTYNYGAYRGSKYMISLETMPIINSNGLSSETLFRHAYGAHFVNHNQGTATFFEQYRSALQERLEKYRWLVGG